MPQTRQFSISYLFLETFWIAAGLGFTCGLAHTEPLSNAGFALSWLLLAGTLIAWGTAIGGLYKRMREGALLGAAILLAIGMYSLVADFPRAIRD